MRKLGVLLVGLALIGGAVGMFGYRWIYKADRSANRPAAVSAAPSDVRRTTKTDPRSAPVPGAKSRDGMGASEAAGWKSVELVLNALNAFCGIVGVWMAWLGLRMQRAVSAMQAERHRDRG